MKVPLLVKVVEEQLAGQLPGIEAQRKMAPVPGAVPPYKQTEDAAVPSAVLILLFPGDEGWAFFLTERSSQVEHHQGQVSLPGGAQERGETLQQTALRETQEELGIAIHGISVLGPLTPLFIPVSGFRVYPFVAWTGEKPDLSPDSSEVNSVHVVSVNQLLDETVIVREIREIRGEKVEIPYFHFDGVKVWGATAVMLSELREILRRANAKPGPIF